MNANDRKTLSRITRCFLLFLILRLVEELLIIPRYVNSWGLIACVGGLVILLIYIRFINKPLEEIGIQFSEHKMRKALAIAVILNVVPAVIVYAVDYLRTAAKPGQTAFSFFYHSSEYAYANAGLRIFLMWLAIGVAISVIYAFFYEMTFRGLLITLGLRSLHFWQANLIQSCLYTIWFLIPVVRVIAYDSDKYSTKQILALFAVMLVYEMICAFKLGLLRYSTGSIWACIFDHFLFACILEMLHVQHTSADMTVQLDQNYYLRMLCYQAISLLIVLGYYLYKKPKIREQLKEQRSMHHSSHHSSHESSHDSAN